MRGSLDPANLDRAQLARVYPRPCGGARHARHYLTNARGLSPPVRGSPGEVAHFNRHAGSIPARAGEPTPLPTRTPVRWVYPRPCGGAHGPLAVPRHVRGLSPPVRGSLCQQRRRWSMSRSIPARAGEPTPRRRSPDDHGVYPRPCGGAVLTRAEPGNDHGLSPPVRGSRRRILPAVACPGSIPARAGEPASPVVFLCDVKVYPRPCGGAVKWNSRRSVPAGLSPPVRGSLIPSCREREHLGSIPARAGEPSRRRWWSSRTGVYPRPCGGAARGTSARAAHVLRSIPARAGEPTRL